MSSYCSTINRNCLYIKECNKKNFSINLSYKSLIFDQTYIENYLLFIWIKKIKKIEKLDFKNLKLKISLYKYIFNHYWSYTFNDDRSIIWKSKNKDFILILSNYNKYIDKYIYYDHSPKLHERVINTWILLWYPSCCIKNHISSVSIKWSYKVDKVFDRDIYSDGVSCKLLNPYLKLYVHIPCSNKCLKTIENAEKILSFLENKYGKTIVDYYFSFIEKEMWN